jgi:tetratricopeptide (TPR) repeat protein
MDAKSPTPNEDSSSLHPADAEVQLAFEQLRQNNLEGAVQHFTTAIELETTEALHYSNRARVLFELGRTEEALADYTAAIELAPSAALYSSRSVIYVALGRTGAALGDLNEAYDLEPTPENLLNRALFFGNRGMAEDALRDMDRVIELQPNLAESHLYRANLIFALLQQQPHLYERGLADLQRAAELDTDGNLRAALAELANQLEKNLPNSPAPALSQRVIDTIRAR